MNILMFCQFPEGYSEEYRARIKSIAPGENILYADDCNWSDEEYHERLAEADVIVSYIPKSDVRYCKNLKLWIFDIAGVDGFIDSPFLPENTIVCNATGSYGNVIAEHAVALTMSICRDIPRYVGNKQRHEWNLNIPDKPVEGSNVLILGGGSIGTTTARYLRPIVGEKGRITGVRRVRRETPECFDAVITFDELDGALAEADIVICALPGTKETAGLLDERRLRLMKEDAVLVNVGRGSLIPLKDLEEVLKEGRFRGVGIDVAEIEPIPPKHPIWDCERLIITPHAAGNSMLITSPTGERLLDLIAENLENYLAGRPLKNIVNRTTGYKKTGT